MRQSNNNPSHLNADVHNYAEYSVVQKIEGKNLRNRILLVLLYIIAGLAFVSGVFVIGFVPLVATLPLLEWALVSRTWKYVQVEHEYCIATGNMTFYEIYGNRKRKLALEADCREMSKIAPYAPGQADEVEKAEVIYDFRGSTDTPDAYYAIFVLGKKKAAVIFEATGKVVKLLKLYNPSATVVSQNLRF